MECLDYSLQWWVSDFVYHVHQKLHAALSATVSRTNRIQCLGINFWLHFILPFFGCKIICILLDWPQIVL